MLDRPEYVHVVINHLPIIGLLVAMLALTAALVTRNRTAILIGLALVGLLTLSAWPVYEFGEEAYDRVLSMADEAGANYLEHHKALAGRWVFLYFVTACVAGLGVILAWKWPRTLVLSSILALVLAAASLAAGGVIAKAGGPIRHREFRSYPPPQPPAQGATTRPARSPRALVLTPALGRPDASHYLMLGTVLAHRSQQGSHF